ncbi:MAG: RluA family pseudouridine synthase [Alphaproteobacteria bacterium]|nr:RluA family pseudouridine synthase [Alphaproteobacteria bacterium]
MSDRQSLQVCEEGAGRLDRFLSKHLNNLRYGALMRAVRKKLIRVNGKRAYVDTMLVVGDTVEVRFLPMLAKEEIALTTKDIAFIESICIFEDNKVWVCNKPCGLAVQDGTSIERSLDALLRAYSHHKGLSRIRLVHRIDRETSGVMVCAKNRESAECLRKEFASRSVQKTYHALVVGHVKRDGVIKRALQCDGGLQDAVTRYEVIRSNEAASLLKIVPLTGRKRQIRRHLASIGHPIIGDQLFLKGEKKLCLHASSLCFNLWGGCTWTAPMSAHLAHMTKKYKV